MSNFDFLKLDSQMAELFQTANTAEQSYVNKDYSTTLFKLRLLAENIIKMVIDKEGLVRYKNAQFHDMLKAVQKVHNKDIDDNHKLYTAINAIRKNGNKAAHQLSPIVANQETALLMLENLYFILIWFMKKYTSEKIANEYYERFLEPEAQERYQALQRKFIYIQTADTSSGLFSAYENAHKIGEGTISEDDLEADWRPNSQFLRENAPKRIKQYMTTAGVPFLLKWVELAYKKATNTFFHDYDVHNVLKRSGIKSPKHLTGNEWFEVDLETAKQAIKAVKEGKNSLEIKRKFSDKVVQLRPNQKEAIERTIKIFKTKDRMLWNAKMRFGKTLASLQLIKEMQFKRVLLMTHRPVVKDSWFEDFKKINMSASGYQYGSQTAGETLENLKRLDSPFVYFASIQWLRYGGGERNLSLAADIDWDLIIIDEAHEGTQTALSDQVMGSILKKQTKVLQLSGTPFNLIDQYEEDQIYTWDYTMEQMEKLRW